MYSPNSDDYDAMERGQETYQYLMSNMTDKEASLLMSSKGVKGIKYLDGNSRSDGTGTSNFVVFDENDMSILSRNGETIR